MSALQLYLMVLLAYFPGFLGLIFWAKTWRFPVVCFAFIGMLAFNAVGSIGVFSDNKFFRLAFDSHAASATLALLLVFQAISFYVICGVYVAFRGVEIQIPKISRLDFFIISLLISAVFANAYVYYNASGAFLLQFLLDGSMNAMNSLYYREKYVYGLRGWSFFNIGFVFLPILLANYGLFAFISGCRHRYIVSAFCFLVSFMASFSLGSKGGALGFLLSIGVAYVCFLGMSGQSPFRIFRSSKFLAFGVVAVGSMIGGYVYTTPADLQHISIADRMLHRIFIAYPETLGAAIDYADKRGALGESVFPTMRGLLSHDQVNLSAVLHQYQADAPGGVSVPFAAEAYLMSGWLGAATALPIVFLTVVAIQEAALRIRSGLLSISFAAIYSYLALQLSINGMFSALYNFMYPGTLLVIGFLAIFFALIDRRWTRRIPSSFSAG